MQLTRARLLVDLAGCLFALAFGWTVAGVVDAQTPTLSELEQAKVELLQVRTAYARLLAQYDGCKAEVGTAFAELGRLRAAQASRELTDEEVRLKASIEAGHVGWTFDPKTGAFTAKPPESTTVKK